MNHPVIMQANAQERYDRMLKAAEDYRRIRRLPRYGLPLRARIPSKVGDALVALIDRSKVQRRTEAKVTR